MVVVRGVSLVADRAEHGKSFELGEPMAKALIVGSRGQDGTYLSKLLVKNGYEVIGIDLNYAHSTDLGVLSPVDIGVSEQVSEFLRTHKPQEIYYLAAFHHSSENVPENDYQVLLRSFSVNVLSLINFLEAMRESGSHARLFYAGSSHVFGDPESPVQDETTPFDPICPYGISKTAGIHVCHYYREAHRLFCAVGILYNHESPYRDPSFVSRKIARAALMIHRGQQEILRLGDLSADIDWGYSPDYVRAMARILHLDRPDDFVIATGELHTVRDFVEAIFSFLGLDWRQYVVEDPSLIAKRPRRNPLCGNWGKLHALTGWKPTVDLNGLAEIMIKGEMERAAE